MITFSINHCRIIRQKEFSMKTENSKIEYFLWNEPSSDSSSFESEQYFLLDVVCLFSGAFILRQDESQHYGKSTN